MQTFIFGHRNPDTDSVCASIALSYLLNETGKNTVAKVLGHLNPESKFVMNYFKVKEPDYLNDTKVRIKDIKYNKKAIVKENKSIYDAFMLMQKEGVTAVPLVDEAKKLTGFVTLKEIAKFLISGDKERVDTSYDNIIRSTNGEELLRFDEHIKGNVMVASFQSKTFHEEVTLTNKDILIVGDRYKILEYAIDFKVKLIVADDYAKYSTDFPILENIENREYYGRSASQIKGEIPIQIHSASTIEGKTAIPSDSEQGLMALIYGKDGLSGIPITEMEKGIVGVENDYVYYLSFQFGGNQSF